MEPVCHGALRGEKRSVRAYLAAVLNGYCKMNENITVNVRGGKMIVKYTGDSVYLSGNTELLYEGDITI